MALDLSSLIANKPLLASLTREYELLKSVEADINYEQWIVKRLKLAAAQQGSRQQHTAAADTPPDARATDTSQAATQSRQVAVNELSVTCHPWAAGATSPISTRGVPVRHANGTWECAGEQPAGSGPVVKPLIEQQGKVDWQAHNTTNTQAAKQLQARSSKAHQPEPLWNQPETSVDTAGTGLRGPASQPHWVAAAKLQSSLQSSGVVPLLHAAAERDRRLAATAALVRQQLALDTSSSSSVLQQPLLPGHGAMVGAGTDPEQQQMQQMLQLTQQVVQQNQLLQQAVQQQHAQLQKHEGFLAGAVHTAAPVLGSQAAGGAAVAGAQASSATQQQLPDAAQNSWLVKSVLHPANSTSYSSAHAKGEPPAPEFIRITGEAGNPSKVKKQVQQQQQQQQQHLDPAERRSQLKAALKQLVTGSSSSSSSRSGQQLPEGVAGLLHALLGERQQQQGLSQQGQQQVISELQMALRALGHNKRQRQTSTLRRSQDENLEPFGEGPHPNQQTPQCSTARQQLLERRQQQQQQRLQEAAAEMSRAKGVTSGGRPSNSRQQQPQQQQQQQPQRQRPAWQSEPFMPPPAHLLRRKHSGLADVWGLPAPSSSQNRASVRPSSASSIGRSGRSKGTQRAAPRPSKSSQKGPAAAQQQHLEAFHERIEQHFQQYSSAAEPFWGPAASTAASPARRTQMGLNASPQQQRSPGRYGVGLAAAAAAAQPGGVRPAVDMSSMSAQEVQQVEMMVQQQLQEDQQQEEEGRLSRLEETATHILGVLGRLEQQLQKPAGPAAVSEAAAVGAQGAAAAAAAAANAGLLQQPLMMSSMLSALDRIEAQEQEIRSRWFGKSEISAEPAAAVVGTGSVLEVKGGIISAYPWQAAAGASSTAAAAVPGHPQLLDEATPGAAAPPAAAQKSQLQQPEVLSKESLKSIKSGRRRFLKHQALVDGQLEVLDSPTGLNAHTAGGVRRHAKQALQPTHVVEAVADLLLDELLLGQVGELDGFCDELCHQLYEDEFEEA